MSEYLIQGGTLSAIADAIRAKTGKSDAMTPQQMPGEIEGISGGGGSELIPACQVRVMPVEIEDPRYYHSEPFQPLPAEISEYPYAVILQKNDGVVRLWLTDNKCYLKTESDGKQKLCVPANNIYFTHSATWCPRGAYMNTWNYGVNGSDAWNIWWSNFDIPRESSEGTDICWYATEPQTQQPADATRFYYNGALLPKIPEGITSDYPYIFIPHGSAGVKRLYAFSTLPYWYPTETYPTCMKAAGAGVEYDLAESGEAWEFLKNHSSMYGVFPNGIAWANYNIPNGSETATAIYLYATQPVPET